MIYKKAYDIVPQNWIITCPATYKILDEVINIIEKTMKTWRVELTAEGESLADSKIQRCIFQGVALSLLLFIVAMTPHNHILGKRTGGYKVCKSQEKINHLMYMDEIKVFVKKEKDLEVKIQAVRIFTLDIGMEFGIEKCDILIRKCWKRHMEEGMK